MSYVLSGAERRIFLFYPCHQQPDDALLLTRGEFPVLRDLIPFLQTASAAAGRCMHRLKNRMSVHGGLLSVIHRLGRSKLLTDEILRMPEDDIRTLISQICAVFFCKMKAGTEFRLIKLCKRFVYRLHVKPAFCIRVTQVQTDEDLW